jgi:hypothetical protein
MFSSKLLTPHLSFAAALRGQADHQPHQETAATTNYTETAPTKMKVHAIRRLVQVPTVNSDFLDLLRAMTVVQQIVAELKGAASEEDKFLTLAKIVFKLMKDNANRFHWALKVIAFNADGILMQRYELSKYLQKLHTDGTLFSETHLKHHERFSIQNYHFYRIDSHPGGKGGTIVAVRKGISHSHVDLPPLILVEATGVSIPTGNTEILLAAVYKSPGRA